MLDFVVLGADFLPAPEDGTKYSGA